MISIIVPCKNRFHQLCMCLDSIYSSIDCMAKAFNGVSIEVIVVNDHSEGGFREKIIKKYKNCLVIDSDGYGPGYARNLGIKKSHGEYLFFTDSDCVVDRFWIINGYNTFLKENSIVIQGIPWLFQKKDNPINGKYEETLYEIMFSRYISKIHTIMTDSRNLLFKRTIVDYIGDEVFSEKTDKATAESRVFGKRCLEAGVTVYFAYDVKVFHEDPIDMKAVCYQKYRHGSGRVLIWEVKQDFDFLKMRYFTTPINSGLPVDYILPAHASFLFGFYNNIEDTDERRKFIIFLKNVFSMYGKSLYDYSELDEYIL